MAFNTLFLLLLYVSTAHAQCTASDYLDKACPDGSSSSPGQLIVDSYGSECDSELPLSTVHDPQGPSVQLTSASLTKIYLLIMADKDAPSRVMSGDKYWRHWVVADIQGADLQNGDASQGTVLTDYNPPSPPPHTNLHRYQFLVFEQDGDGQSYTPSGSRGGWDLAEYINNMQLCNKLAGVYQYTTQNQ